MNHATIAVRPDRIVKPQSDLFGLFFEDLSHAADGGLYAELVRNRSFEFQSADNPSYTPLTAWEKVARGDSHTMLRIEDAHPLNARNTHYLHMEVTSAGEGGGIANLGYGAGIPLEKGAEYRFSCHYRLRGRHAGIPLLIRLEDASGTTVYAEAQLNPAISNDPHDWMRFHATLVPNATDPAARLALVAKQPLNIDLDMVSLFPADTFRGRKNGLRRDIATMLADMKPKFLRFPGGCVMHIGSMNPDDHDSIYRWKNTLGPVEERPSRRNNWNYNSSFGLGYFEFFQYCEDIGAEPLPVIAAGWDPHDLRATPLEDMDEWVAEALDLIEFANGAEDSRWGAVRADMGHPEPFGMKYLGIGNEETGAEFFERYEIIAEAVRREYPNIQIIGSAGPTIGGPDAREHYEQGRHTGAAYMDEHYYQCPEWYIANVDRYADPEEYPTGDSYPRAFLGEYASCGKTWGNALAEAAFLTGVEKAPGIGLACYAPMLCHVDYGNWEPNMVYYDNHRVYGTPSYWVQRLFMRGQGTALLESSDDLAADADVTLDVSGMLRMTTTNAVLDVTNFETTTLDDEPLFKLDDFALSPEHPTHDCGYASGKRYRVTFDFTRRVGSLNGDLNGQYAFGLDFAMHGPDDLLHWGVSGWQQQSGLTAKTHGGMCSMELSWQPVRNGKTYHCELTVDGNHVRGLMDGRELFDYTIKSPVPRPLYHSAVMDEDGSVVVKLVNVRDEPVEVAVELDGWADGTAQVEAIEGIEPEATNDFDHPQRVAPIPSLAQVKDGRLDRTMPAHSLAVLRLHRD